MLDLKISQMLLMQRQLFELHAHEWQPRVPETAPFQLLWSIDELGEVIAIIKKKTSAAVMENGAVREHFVEEMDDVFMYLFDTLLCFGMDESDIGMAYLGKYGARDLDSDLSFSRMIALEADSRKKAGLSVLPDHSDCAIRLFTVVEAIGAMGSEIRKNGAQAVSIQSDTRTAFLKKTADVFAAMFDVALSMGISANELSTQYEKKFSYNIKRDWHAQNKKLYEEK